MKHADETSKTIEDPQLRIAKGLGHPDLQDFASQRPEAKRFRPIQIKGRPLSETVVEGRR